MEKASHRVVVLHGFDDSKHFALPVSPEMGVYFVSFDRAGYGESDPHPARTVQSDAMDVEEFADRLGLGPRFYLVGASLGSYPVWACIKHFPHRHLSLSLSLSLSLCAVRAQLISLLFTLRGGVCRVAGAALVAPLVNFWWASLPAEMARAAYEKREASDQRAMWIARYAPWLLHGYMTQNLVTPSAALARHPNVFSPRTCRSSPRSPKTLTHPRLQGVHESLHRDMMVAFGDWGFDPLTDLAEPCSGEEGGAAAATAVHLWHGREDRLFPVELLRHVAARLPWIRYHECADCGHLFVHNQTWSDAILRDLLARPGQPQPSPGEL
ncbi:unnamed protein product [Spirodela intermedia]|uniref:AB hydrolase-1 domain-containing protein n=1 Tax=Spirodela intermedia TaxID=51605 RepID=A0A7I8JED1_SPIIN|nr:unnamed protein product [Spirodela intermedia]CAA6668508.1 unnamed protein product [Spirodela intermedia]